MIFDPLAISRSFTFTGQSSHDDGSGEDYNRGTTVLDADICNESAFSTASYLYLLRKLNNYVRPPQRYYHNQSRAMM